MALATALMTIAMSHDSLLTVNGHLHRHVVTESVLAVLVLVAVHEQQVALVVYT